MLPQVFLFFAFVSSLVSASSLNNQVRVFQDGRQLDLAAILPTEKIIQLQNKKLIGDDVVPNIPICGPQRRIEDMNRDALLSGGFLTSPDYAPPIISWGKHAAEQQKIPIRPYPGCYIDVTVGAHQMLRVTMKDYSMRTWSGELNEFCKKSYLEFSAFDLEKRLHHSRKVCCPRGAIPLQEVYLSPARTSFVRIRFVAEEPMKGRGWKVAYELTPETAILK